MSNKIFNDISKKIKYDDIQEFINDINNAQPITNKKQSDVESVHVVQIAAVAECLADNIEEEMDILKAELTPLVLAEDLVVFKGTMGYEGETPMTGFAFRVIIKTEDTGAALIAIGEFFRENTQTLLREMDITTGVARRPKYKQI